MNYINLADRDLFGNEAAEDEEDDVFDAYAVTRDEVDAFADPLRRICIVRAYKGEGKSALLRISATAVRRASEPPLLISGPINNFAPTLEATDFDAWVRAWKAALVDRVAHQIGSTLGFAWQDDSMALVEHAEKAGARPRSLVGAVVDRLVGKAKLGSDLASVELGARKLGVSDAEQTVRRWSKDKEPIWLIVDDVDQNFENTPAYRVRVAAFFVACRQLANSVPEMRIRAAVRPNVWATIKMFHEPLSHIEQYITELSWDETAMRRLLAKRVQGYLTRRDRWRDVVPDLPTDNSQRERQLIGLVFEDPIEWGRTAGSEKGDERQPRQRPPHVVLHTLSKHRPRWSVELCSLAAREAAKNQHSKVMKVDLTAQLDGFGRRRIQDTVAEFRSQCPEVEELMSALHGVAEEFATDELVRTIENRVINHVTPHISGVTGPAKALDVAAFLFEIGVIFARRDHADGSYEHIAYAERPALLRSRTNVDAGLRWEVHPVFRQALELRDATGREVAPTKRRRIVKQR